MELGSINGKRYDPTKQINVSEKLQLDVYFVFKHPNNVDKMNQFDCWCFRE